MRRLHPEAIATARREHPELEDLPDELVAELMETQLTSMHLALRDLGAAIAVELRRVRRALARLLGGEQ